MNVPAALPRTGVQHALPRTGVQHALPRNAALLSGLDIARLQGVEIGPLDRPVVTPAQGRILYVDHADTETLRAKYAGDPGVRTAALAPVGHVWDRGGAGLDAWCVAYGPVDYVVAAHVAEHVPDLIGWLRALARALSPGGQIRLVLPDRRFCFDHHRAESRLADLLAAEVAGCTRPPPARVADQYLTVVAADPACIWRGEVPPPPPVDAARYRWAEAACRASLAPGAYEDVHCWVVTPRSFCLLLADLAAFGVLALRCSLFRDTQPDGLDFIVGLAPCDDRGVAASSWRDAAAQSVAAPRAANSVSGAYRLGARIGRSLPRLGRPLPPPLRRLLAGLADGAAKT
ncbi:methyltransferase domain-containing protein [Lichenicoccus sp.]|uniref:methyltransferase domain-containing protein n=1 Tax=Lichenicoccus sp. TaxID=2781899 RepID=UPI003D105E8E